jgi:hypothetical protein
MTGSRSQYLLLVTSFLAIIGVVGVSQVIVEIRGGDPVQLLDLFRHVPTKANLRSFEKELERQSWFARTLGPVMQYGRFGLLSDTGEKALLGKDGWWFYRPGVRYLIDPIPQDTVADHGLEAARLAIIDFRDQLAAMDIRLLVVPAPGKASVYPDRLTGRLDEALTTGPTQRLIADLERAGVEVVNLFDVFRDERSRSTADDALLYLPRDTHWTPAGVRVAARATAQRIGEMGVVSAGSAEYDLQSVVIDRPGDVVRMLRVPRIERLCPGTEIKCEQVVSRATGEPYRSSDESSVLVLGDSFLRIYERDEPGSAGFIAHLAYELRQPLSSVVNDGGASTLVRQELSRKKEMLAGKKLVVWEFVERDVSLGLEGWKRIAFVDQRERAEKSGQMPSADPE